MVENIEKTIKSLMSEPQCGPQTPRDLTKFLLSASDLVKSKIPPKRYLVSTFIPSASLGMVFAPRGIGKSWFSMALAKAISAHLDTFLGWQIHENGDVLFFDGEMSLIDLKERSQLLFGQEGSPNFHILPSEQLFQNGTPICLDKPEEHDAILLLLEHMEKTQRRPKLIIFDNLSTLRRGVNENDNSETERLLSFLIKLRHMGYAVILVHHSNKAGFQRGASILEVPLDYIIKLNFPDKGEAVFKNGACFRVELNKCRNKEPKQRDFLCELKQQENGLLAFSVNNSMDEIPIEMVLLRALAEGTSRPSVRFYANKLGFSVGTTQKYLKTLRDDYAINKTGFNITDRGACMLYEWFPQKFPEPDDYQAYQAEIPF